MTRPIERILAVAQGIRAAGTDRWMVKSPLAPGQRTGSIALRELPDGRVLVHDFAGGQFADVMAAWGLATSDLFPDAPLTFSGSAHHSKPGRRRLLSAYDALRVVEREAHLVAIAAGNVGHGVILGNADRHRVLLAGGRILAAYREVLS